MRKLAIVIWLMIPVAALAYHYGPGQRQMMLDQIDVYMSEAELAVDREDWPHAVFAYEKAMEAMPESLTLESYRVRLELNKARIQDQGLAEAYQDLPALVEDMLADGDVPEELIVDARQTMANTQYYMTWLRRLELQGKDQWEPDIESARQTYTLLAEDAVAAGNDKAAEKHKKDLEAAIRLARMDLGELQGLPLPSNCQGCCACKKPNMKIGKKKVEDARGASSGPPPDGQGS